MPSAKMFCAARSLQRAKRVRYAALMSRRWFVRHVDTRSDLRRLFIAATTPDAACRRALQPLPTRYTARSRVDAPLPRRRRQLDARSGNALFTQQSDGGALRRQKRSG